MGRGGAQRAGRSTHEGQAPVGWQHEFPRQKNETVILVIFGCLWLFFTPIFAVTYL
jgi:hypothetical protein